MSQSAPECSKHPQWQPQGMEFLCPYCAKANVKRTKRYSNNYRLAGNSELRLSGKALQKRNLRIKERDGYICQMCKRPTEQGAVDHIIALANDGPDTDDNLQWLCHPCHDIKTRSDLGQKVKGNDKSGLPTDPNHHWNTE